MAFESADESSDEMYKLPQVLATTACSDRLAAAPARPLFATDRRVVEERRLHGAERAPMQTDGCDSKGASYRPNSKPKVTTRCWLDAWFVSMDYVQATKCEYCPLAMC